MNNNLPVRLRVEHSALSCKPVTSLLTRLLYNSSTPAFYQHRFVIERAFGELDGFKALVLVLVDFLLNHVSLNLSNCILLSPTSANPRRGLASDFVFGV